MKTPFNVAAGVAPRKMGRRARGTVAALCAALCAFGTAAGAREGDTGPREKALDLARKLVIVDTHIDVPYRLRHSPADISVRAKGGDFDYPRAREGGLDGVFMSIFTPAALEKSGGSKALADSLIALVESLTVRWPDKFALATRPAQVNEATASGKVALMLGMENGSPIESRLENLEYFHGRGVRYITLTHSEDNHICDSSYDKKRTWGGLSPFGKSVVAEMNRLGIIIDVSHVSDDAFYQVLELSSAPVIASHSSCRHFTPGFERNLDDEMIRKLAEKGGVIHVNFGSVFLSDKVNRSFYEGKGQSEQFAKENELSPDHPKVRDFEKQYFKDHPTGFADVSEVADHIDHVVRLVGPDHVGLGSDFDGVGDSLPVGLKDVSQYPNLILELLERGYTEEMLSKICSGNLFRVWNEVERVSAERRVTR